MPIGDKAQGTAALLDALKPLAEAGLVDETILLHPGAGHSCPTSKAGSGAKVYRDAGLMPGFGLVRGYGDAVWRGL